MPNNIQNSSATKDMVTDRVCDIEPSQAVTQLADNLKSLLARHSSTLSEEGVNKEMQQLERWLETEDEGPAPACVVTEGGIAWLMALRDRMKLSADEAQRLEGEGGNPSSKEQVEKLEALLKTIRRIDAIINDNTTAQPH